MRKTKLLRSSFNSFQQFNDCSPFFFILNGLKECAVFCSDIIGSGFCVLI